MTQHNSGWKPKKDVKTLASSTSTTQRATRLSPLRLKVATKLNQSVNQSRSVGGDNHNNVANTGPRRPMQLSDLVKQLNQQTSNTLYAQRQSYHVKHCSLSLQLPIDQGTAKR